MDRKEKHGSCATTYHREPGFPIPSDLDWHNTLFLCLLVVEPKEGLVRLDVAFLRVVEDSELKFQRLVLSHAK